MQPSHFYYKPKVSKRRPLPPPPPKKKKDYKHNRRWIDLAIWSKSKFTVRIRLFQEISLTITIFVAFAFLPLSRRICTSDSRVISSRLVFVFVRIISICLINLSCTYLVLFLLQLTVQNLFELKLGDKSCYLY